MIQQYMSEVTTSHSRSLQSLKTEAKIKKVLRVI